MKDINLSNIKVFKSISCEEIEKLLKICNLSEKYYDEDEIIVFEGDECNFIGIITSGMVDVKKISTTGKEYIITTLCEGDTFGEAVIFSSTNTFPATIVAKCPTRILILPKPSVLEMSKISEKFLSNFLNILSDRILLLNTKLKECTLSTLRQKICNFLIEEYKKQKSLKIKLNLSKQELSEKFNVQRPSLSRELIKMREEGLIDFWRKEIHIKDIKAIEDYLFKED